jgi:hypothetical protein
MSKTETIKDVDPFRGTEERLRRRNLDPAHYQLVLRARLGRRSDLEDLAVGYDGRVQDLESADAALLARAGGRAALRCGSSEYPLRPSLDRDWRERLGRALGLSGYLGGDRLDREVHRAFQRLRYTPVHEQTAADQELWAELLRVIDYDAYIEETPVIDTLVGRLVAKDIDQVVVEWFGGDTERFDYRDVPPAINGPGAVEGVTVHAVLERYPAGKVKRWVSLAISPPFATHREATEDDWKEIAPIDDLPAGRWPKR